MQGAPVKKVLFVCVHNSGRSQMAEALFNRYAAGAATAYSAGTSPADRVNPVVSLVMRESGIDISGHQPKMLTIEMLDSADRVITMGCGVEQACPAAIVQTEDWMLDDPEGKPVDEVRKIRDAIESRVKTLIEEISEEKT
jgi:arsenate reductase (thioredoxin)